MLSEEMQKVLSSLPSGKLTYTFRNDYMFKAVLQQNEKALRGLICALLSLRESEIKSLQILNPIELGKTIDDKTCILDIKLILNSNVVINVEMQVRSVDCWPERSLIYLCRAFDQLKTGEDYLEIRPTIHIGIIDFHLPKLIPKFFSGFQMTDEETREVYSDKFILHVLNLKVLDDMENPEISENIRKKYAEEIAKRNPELYKWAKLFKATTWEELKKLAENNESIANSIVTYRLLSEDEKIQQMCEARFKYECDMASAKGTGRREGLTKGIYALILDNMEMGIDRETIVHKVVQRFGVSQEDAAAYFEACVKDSGACG